MEKYGVEIDEEKEKTAHETTKPMCPRCSRELDSVTPPHCPNCGTKPFEKQKAMTRQESKTENFNRIYRKPKD